MKYSRLVVLTTMLGLACSVTIAQTSNKLNGKAVSCASVDKNSTADKAFDGKQNTYFWSNQRKFGWVGLELPEKCVITKVGYCPAAERERMFLGVIEGANSPDFMDAIPIYMIQETPTAGMHYADVSCSRGFKYVRFVMSNHYTGNNGYSAQGDTVRCKVSELEFYGYASEGDDSKLFQLTKLPTVTIHTVNEKDILNKEDWVDGTISIISDNGKEFYSDALQIKGRGNASWGFAKKPYKIKLANKVKLLGMPAKEKKWTFINNMGDKTLMRNLIAFEASRIFGLEYTPAARSVDVFVNGEYRGNYQLCDQVEQGDNRVNVTKMKNTDTEGDNLTGGYMIEIDAYAPDEGEQKRDKSWFYTNHNTPVTIKYPDEDDIVPQQTNYIKQYVNKVQQAVYDRKKSEIDKIFDVESFLKHFLIGEFSGNTDTYWSVYMYKDRLNDIMFTGPVWDFDIAFENDYRTYPINNKTQYLFESGGSEAAGMNTFAKNLITDYKDDLQYIWSYARANGFTKDYILSFIDNTANDIRESANLNFMRWPILNYKVHMNPRALGSFDAEVNAVKTYVSQRFDWLDKKIGIIPTGTENTEDSNTVNVYSNDGMLCVSGIENGTVSVYNDMGALIYESNNKGSIEIMLPKGVYSVLHNGNSCRILVE
ncbi:MAG: CotH kinase family protein [Paludibacteraceae bacterium]|nr:CotH kinase family protein [Paludibacteraceae bacterium]